MSFDATNRVYEDIIPTLRARLRDEIAVDRRPGFSITRSVLVYLADKYQPKRSYVDRDGVEHRGYVDESVPQIMRALDEKERTVKVALGALDDLGLVTVITKGNQHNATKRRMPFAEPVEQVQADPPMLDEQHGRADLPEQISEQVQVAEEQVQVDAEHGQTDLPTPPCIPAAESPKRGVGVIPRDTYEVDPFDPARPTVFQMARNQVNLHPEEVDQYIEDAISLHGVRRVTDVVAALAEATSPNTYARQFDKKLTRALNAYQIQRVVLDRDDPFVPANTPAPIDRPTGNPHTGCTTCNGSGWATPTDEKGEPTGEPVYRCPERHLKAVGA